MPVVEGSSCVLVLNFADEDGVAVTPDSATYRIDNVPTKVSILVETPFSPTSAIHNLDITGDQNAVIDQGQEIEEHEITVSFTYSGGTKVGKSSYILEVENLRFF